MYRREWSINRVEELIASHTRATDILEKSLGFSRVLLTSWLQSGDSKWDSYKYLLRHLELGLQIKHRPGTPIHLSSEQAWRIIITVLQSSNKSLGETRLTDLRSWITLIPRLVWERYALTPTRLAGERRYADSMRGADLFEEDHER